MSSKIIKQINRNTQKCIEIHRSATQHYENKYVVVNHHCQGYAYSLPADKLQGTRELVSSWMFKKKTTKCGILSLIEVLQHATRVVQQGRTFLSRISHLQAALSFYYQRDLATSTIKLYHVGQKRYIQFCIQHNLTTSPTTELILLSFAAYLAKTQHNTSYHKSIHLCHLQISYHLDQVNREQAYSLPARVHLPFTTQIMQKINNYY